MIDEALPPMGLSCPLCEGTASQLVLEIPNTPVLCNLLCTEEDEARRTPRGDIALSRCDKCGLMYNRLFDPGLVAYTPAYDNSLHYSKEFNQFADTLADHLLSSYALNGRTVVEIGCGDGRFLHAMCEKGVAAGVGFDPSHGLTPSNYALSKNLQIIPGQFSKAHLPRQVDALICRHVLEHVPRPVVFLQEIRESIQTSDTIYYFEVPNAQWIMESTSVYDVIYEHLTYWTEETLTRLFMHCGFHILSCRSGFGGQYLMLEARSHHPRSLQQRESRKQKQTDQIAVQNFGRQSVRLLNKWSAILEKYVSANKKVCLWGAGSKGVSFVNVVPGADSSITCLVDLSPVKQGKYVAGCGLPIISPAELPTLRPDVVLIMNPVYESEITEILAELGLMSEIELLLAIEH